MILIYISPQYHRVQDSQVIYYLNRLQESNYFEKIFLLIGDYKSNNLLNKKINVFSFPVFGHYYIIHFITGFLVKVFLFYIIITNYNKKFIIHNRSEIPLLYFSKAFFKKKIKILCDIRGAIDQEIYFFNTSKRFILKLKEVFIQRSTQKLCDKIIAKTFISPQLRNYYEKKNVSCDKCFITESMVLETFEFNENMRYEIRKELNIQQNEILIVYPIGGEESWQNLDNVVEIINPNYYTLLLLTKRDIKPQKGLIVKYVDYNEMPKYLSAADYGLLFRDFNIINKVALPIKSLEYCCSGLPIIRNKSIPYLEEILKDDTRGIIINSLKEIVNINFKICDNSIRKKYSINYLNKFSINSILIKYIKIYDYLKESSR